MSLSRSLLTTLQKTHCEIIKRDKSFSAEKEIIGIINLSISVILLGREGEDVSNSLQRVYVALFLFS